jgi:glucokinase
VPGNTIGAMKQPVRAAGGAARRRTEPVVLALDFGGTQLRAAVVAEDGSLAARAACRTPSGGAQAIVGECLKLLREVTAEAGTAAGRPHALGISAPGPLDPVRGVLHDPPNLDRSLWGFALADALSTALDLPAHMDKDTNVAALAEGRFGAARGLADYVYMTVSTGVGGAVVSGGQLVTGADGAGGELGHLMVDPAGPLCGCGVRGHLEALSSGTGIAAAARRALESGEAAPGTPLAETAAQRGPTLLEARDVAEAEEQGDPVAASIMADARRAFASAMVTVVNVFNPQRVIVGGGIADGQGERLLAPARRLVASDAFRIQAKRVEIVPSELGDDVGLVGASALVDQRLGPSGGGEAQDRKPAEMTLGRLALSGDAQPDDDSVVAKDREESGSEPARPGRQRTAGAHINMTSQPMEEVTS